jgi:dTDP-4-amino-4,6-dideoxy-D-glucose acyltransferase
MPDNNSFYAKAELNKLGFKSLGRDVLISRFARFYGAENISIGDHARIDDFCVLSGNIQIGAYIHIAVFCGLFGEAGITMEDFSGLSSRVSIYSGSDDYLGNALTNPTVPNEFRKVIKGPIILKKHSLVGSGALILPDSLLDVGSVLGSLSLIKGRIPPWQIYAGIPARFIKERRRDVILELEKKLM